MYGERKGTDLVESDPTFSAGKNLDNLDFTVPDPQGYGYGTDPRICNTESRIRIGIAFCS